MEQNIKNILIEKQFVDEKNKIDQMSNNNEGRFIRKKRTQLRHCYLSNIPQDFFILSRIAQRLLRKLPFRADSSERGRESRDLLMRRRKK